MGGEYTGRDLGFRYCDCSYTVGFKPDGCLVARLSIHSSASLGVIHVQVMDRLMLRVWD